MLLTLSVCKPGLDLPALQPVPLKCILTLSFNFIKLVNNDDDDDDDDEDDDYDDYDNNNSIQFFILTCWLNSYKSQLQSQHKKIINVQKYAYA
jgi:hypothetical protein